MSKTENTSMYPRYTSLQAHEQMQMSAPWSGTNSFFQSFQTTESMQSFKSKDRISGECVLRSQSNTFGSLSHESWWRRQWFVDGWRTKLQSLHIIASARRSYCKEKFNQSVGMFLDQARCILHHSTRNRI